MSLKESIFFDEIQRITQWQDSVNSFRVDFDCDIYITGSNAYLLSGEYATYLAGRYVEIKMLPLSFAEFIDFYGYTVRESQGSLGRIRKRIYDANGESYEPQRQITDPDLLRKIIMFLADNIGNNTSITSIGNTLVNEKLLDISERRGKPAVQTIQAYVGALLESYVFYEIKRYDVKGREYLRTLGKYYIVDIGLRNYLLGFRDMDTGHVMENIVYFELLRRGYDVAICKIYFCEISAKDYLSK